MSNLLPSSVATWLATLVAACGAAEHEPCTSNDECQSGLRCAFRNGSQICEEESEPSCRATSDCASPQICNSLKFCSTPCQTESDCVQMPGCCGAACTPDPVGSICACVGCD